MRVVRDKSECSAGVGEAGDDAEECERGMKEGKF